MKSEKISPKVIHAILKRGLEETEKRVADLEINIMRDEFFGRDASSNKNQLLKEQRTLEVAQALSKQAFEIHVNATLNEWSPEMRKRFKKAQKEI